MAAGTKTLTQEKGGWAVYATLLSGAGGTTNGEWFPIHGVWPLSVTIEGGASATAQVYVSNAASCPADSNNSVPQLGSDITGSGAVTIDAPYKWVKVRVSAWSSGTVTAYVASGISGAR